MQGIDQKKERTKAAAMKISETPFSQIISHLVTSTKDTERERERERDRDRERQSKVFESLVCFVNTDNYNTNINVYHTITGE